MTLGVKIVVAIVCTVFCLLWIVFSGRGMAKMRGARTRPQLLNHVAALSSFFISFLCAVYFIETFVWANNPKRDHTLLFWVHAVFILLFVTLLVRTVWKNGLYSRDVHKGYAYKTVLAFTGLGTTGLLLFTKYL